MFLKVLLVKQVNGEGEDLGWAIRRFLWNLGKRKEDQSIVVEIGRGKKFIRNYLKIFKRLGTVTCWNTSEMQVELMARQL